MFCSTAVNIVDQVLRAEAWAYTHPEETRQFLARESNSSEYWVAVAYGQDAHLRLRTNLTGGREAVCEYASF
jgi:ABC-type nitrate/sulfonate/bicarbonate transport system substrate-binding protein